MPQSTVDSEIFARILFSGIALKDISDVKNLRLKQDLPISINNRVVLSFREGFIFTKLHEVLAKFSEFTVII